MSPFIIYFESEIQHSGVTRSVSCSATTRAANSLVWLDCSSPEILITWFSRCSH